MKTEPKIYVASLADYNAGRLHGKWIDIVDEEQVKNEISEILKTSPEPIAEEWAIHDYEGFGGYSVSEWADIKTLCALANLIDEHGEVIADFFDQTGCDLDKLEDHFLDSYQGKHDSLQDWADNYLEDTGQLSQIPENLRFYFDSEKFANDMDVNGDIFTLDSDDRGVHIFWNV